MSDCKFIVRLSSNCDSCNRYISGPGYAQIVNGKTSRVYCQTCSNYIFDQKTLNSAIESHKSSLLK